MAGERAEGAGGGAEASAPLPSGAGNTGAQQERLETSDGTGNGVGGGSSDEERPKLSVLIMEEVGKRPELDGIAQRLSLTSKDLEILGDNMLWASLSGFFIGGWSTSRAAAEQYLKESETTRFRSQFDMQRGLQDSIMRSFFVNGARWGWKLGVFMGMFGSINLGLERYRRKKDFLNILTAGATSGLAFGALQGPRAAIGGLLGGTVLSVPFGALVQAGYWLEEYAVEKKRRMQEAATSTSSTGEDSSANQAK